MRVDTVVRTGDRRPHPRPACLERTLAQLRGAGVVRSERGLAPIKIGRTLRSTWQEVRDATVRILEETGFGSPAGRVGSWVGEVIPLGGGADS